MTDMTRKLPPLDIDNIRRLLRRGEGTRVLEVVGDRWAFLILRDAFLRVRRFEDLRRRTGAARGTLAARLAELVEHGVLQRLPYGTVPGRLEYRLTEKGLGFYPVALCMWSWENRWSAGFDLPPRMTHRRCGHDLDPRLTCGHCDQTVHLRDIGYTMGPGARHAVRSARATRRRQTAGPGGYGEGVDTTMFHAVDTVADRWTAVLLAAMFFGLRRYDDINAALGIATNILADRLRLLLSAGVIERQIYQERPPRHEYRLTEKGLELFPFTLAMHEWGARWMPAPHGPVIRLMHQPCGHALRSQLTCGACGQLVDPHDVLIAPPPKARRARTAHPGPRAQERGGKGKKPLVRRT
jgi:DNA-binding HxlR family transcriptional regulator